MGGTQVRRNLWISAICFDLGIVAVGDGGIVAAVPEEPDGAYVMLQSLLPALAERSLWGFDLELTLEGSRDTKMTSSDSPRWAFCGDLNISFLRVLELDFSTCACRTRRGDRGIWPGYSWRLRVVAVTDVWEVCSGDLTSSTS